MQTWVISAVVLSLICHGCFVGAIVAMMKAEERKKHRHKA